ncbi:MAG: hypothetical protein NTV14_07960 [Coprothermobacterota bacterium]|nr:hypothetical protein [Coprothermobacterota bacterium]
MRPPPELQILLWVRKEEEFYTQNVLESYDGMVLIADCRRLGEEVEMVLSSSSSFREELRKVLDGLAEEVDLRYQEISA